MIELGMTFRF